jgi:cell wall-associated NlpC family hydrolase
MLSDVGDAVTGGLAVVGRSGAVLAASTGLIAAVGMPAQAGAGSDTALVSSTDASVRTGGARLAAQESFSALLTGERVSAPMAATVTFETDDFQAVPNPPPHRPRRAAAPVEPAHQAKAKPTQAKPEHHAVVPAKAAPHKAAPQPKHTKSAKPKHSKHAAATAPAPTKSPTRKSSRPPATSPAPGSSVRGSSVLAVAARYVGTPYVYGGTSPHGFDCSGYVGYVYRQLGVSLPRTANQQMGATKRISRSQARAGDLVFFVSASRAYHVGIYAGNGMMYDAPHTGSSVGKHKIWDAAAVFGRVSR